MQFNELNFVLNDVPDLVHKLPPSGSTFAPGMGISYQGLS